MFSGCRASLDERQRLQTILFPQGLEHDGEGFGNAVTSYAFNYLGQNEGGEFGLGSEGGNEGFGNALTAGAAMASGGGGDGKYTLVTPEALNWKRTVEWLRAVDAVRQAGLLRVA